MVAVLPAGTTVEEIASAGLAPGIVSAGLGSVPIAQTFLDISQGNRVSESLYDGELPRLTVRDGQVPGPEWARTLERAESAPADVVPGLLGSTLADAGIPVRAERGAGAAALIAVDRKGAVPLQRGPGCPRRCAPGLTVLRAGADGLGALARGVREGELLIAIADAARGEQKLLPMGIAGEGFAGDLTSASTRMDGLVTATDIAPTVLDQLGAGRPDEMNGSAITSGEERDPEAVVTLQSDLDHRPGRDAVVLLPLAIWLAITAAAALAGGRPAAALGLRLLGLSCALAPTLLLVAALDLGELPAALLVGAGAPALALVLERALGGCSALALACAVTVAAYAVDVVIGSPLTARSVLGPDPGAGVRFFGIGNELEAVLSALTLIGTGAYLQMREALAPRRAALWFVGVAAVAIAAFAPGRFGADVGAAIVLGVGSATAAVIALRLDRRRGLLIVVGGGAAALAALIAVDLALGGAHLSRSVLGAGDASDVRDVFDRRLRLMVHTFTHPVYPGLLAGAIAVLVAGAVQRRRVLSWFDRRRLALSGFLGAVAGILVGTIANDSGSVLLVIGTIYLAVAAGYFWATRQHPTAVADGG